MSSQNPQHLSIAYRKVKAKGRKSTTIKKHRKWAYRTKGLTNLLATWSSRDPLWWISQLILNRKRCLTLLKRKKKFLIFFPILSKRKFLLYAKSGSWLNAEHINWSSRHQIKINISNNTLSIFTLSSPQCFRERWQCPAANFLSAHRGGKGGRKSEREKSVFFSWQGNKPL